MSNKKAAIYIRVSTEAQREEGYSIDAQKEMLAAHCISKGIKNYEYYVDGGFTGSNIKRPELQRLISDVKKDVIDCVLVYKLDRLSRSQKDTLYLIEDVFNPHGVDFISLNESMDTSTPLGRLMLGILSAFAQLERENIRERTRMGMKERVKSGLWMGGGRVPFGYDYDRENGVLVPNADADTVRKIYDLYLAGHSVAYIAKTLGLKYEKLALQILTRKSNAGFIQYNSEEYLGKHEPLITLETYQKAMDLMAHRASKRVSESSYLLQGLITCGICGAKMRYQKWGKRDCKIVCYSRDHSKPHLVRDPDCDNSRLWASDLEDIVLKDIFSFALKSDAKQSRQETVQSILEVLEGRHREISIRIKRLYDLYAKNEDDLLLDAITDMQKQRVEIQAQMTSEHERSAISKRHDSIKKTLETLSEAWSYMTPRERKNAVRSCVDRVVITDEQVEIYYQFDSISDPVQ